MGDPSADALWEHGQALEQILPAVETFAGRHGLSLMPRSGRRLGYPPPWGQKPYTVKWWRNKAVTSVEVDSPLELRPTESPEFGGLDWQLYAETQKPWFWFSITREGWSPGRVLRLHIAFDGDFQQWPIPEDDREVVPLVTKYRQLKALFHDLEADVLCGWSDHFRGGYVPAEEDPEAVHQVFRFAKRGRQVLVRPLEEGRGRRAGENDWRVIVDPD